MTDYNGYTNEQTYDVALVLSNTEELYWEIGEAYDHIIQNISCDSGRIDELTDQIEDIVHLAYKNGTETVFGKAVLDYWLAHVRWFELGRDFYNEFGSGEVRA